MELYGNVSDKKAIAGLLFGMNPKSVITYIANGVVNYGKGLFMLNGKVSNTKMNNKAVLDLSAYTTASKDIIAKINGVTVTTLTTTGVIATDVATLVASIASEVSGVTAVAGADNKITVTSDNDSAVVVELSYDGSDVTSSKVTASSDYAYVGVALFHQDSHIESRGCYPDKESVACLEFGYVWGQLASDETPKDGDTAYVTSEGLFTTSSSNNTQVGKFKSSAEDGLALIDVLK